MKKTELKYTANTGIAVTKGWQTMQSISETPANSDALTAMSLICHSNIQVLKNS